MLLRYIFFFSLLLLTTLGISPSAGFSGFMPTTPNIVYGSDGDRINIVPQASMLNRKSWKKMENRLRDELKAGKKVTIEIDVSYPNGNTKRPNEFHVKAMINGEPKLWEFNQ